MSLDISKCPPGKAKLPLIENHWIRKSQRGFPGGSDNKEKSEELLAESKKGQRTQGLVFGLVFYYSPVN